MYTFSQCVNAHKSEMIAPPQYNIVIQMRRLTFACGAECNNTFLDSTLNGFFRVEDVLLDKF